MLQGTNDDMSLLLLRYEFDPEQFAGSSIPMLVIGTKLDLAQAVRDNKSQRTSSIAEECGADEINLVSSL